MLEIQILDKYLLILKCWPSVKNVKMLCEDQITQIYGLEWPPVTVTPSESCSLSLKFCNQFINEATEAQRPA